MAEHAQSPPSPPHPAISPEIVEPQVQSPSTISSYIPSIISSVHQGAGYTPIDDFQDQDTSYKGASPKQPQTGDEDDSVHGLRIQFPDDGEERERRLSFGATVMHKPSSNSLLSPNSARSMGLGRHSRSASLDSEEQDITYRRGSEPSLYRSYTEDDDTRNLAGPRASTPATSITIGQTLHPDEPLCKTKHHFFQGRANWLYITIISLSVYSTIFSAIWLGLAVTKPHYGRHIMDNGPLTPSTASLLCAAFAKTIELSFVTVFVSFLGQVLSHRAIVTNSKGITIAEMAMRAWVQQPGTMITHWESVRYAGLTFLGAISLTAALMAMFYTTASDALVAPKLKFGSSKLRVLHGEVKTIFANESQQVANCKTPMNNDNDNWNYGPTCVEIEHSGQAYHNYAQFLTNWDVIIKAGNGTIKQSKRPLPVGMLFDNTSITGSWVEIKDMNDVSNDFNRVVNNVTLAMPLTSVFNAAKHPVNGILQPQELDGLGEYYVHASVPSPTINVLCASMTEKELQPLIVSTWPGTHNAFNASLYPDGYDIPRRPSWFNKTVVDDLFGWGERYGRRAPVFPIIPASFNTVYNNTDEESDSLYVLATSNYSAVGDPSDTKMNMICSLRSAMSPNCSTTFHSSFSGSALSTNCEDPHDQMAYTHSRPDATSGVTNVNWTTVANQWGLTVSLGAGLTNDDASNARLLTQMMPRDRQLDIARPSIAEALAVEAGCTVILAGIDSPLIHYWNYTDQLDINGQTWKRNQTEFQAFNATVRSQEYSSGGTLRWQGAFYVILVAVFLTNAFCLAYFVLGHSGLVTDYIEPQNLFALSLGSPPSKALEGACGGGPEGDQFLSSWHIELDRRRDHFFVRSLDVPGEGEVRRRRNNRKSKDVGDSEEDEGPIMDGSTINNRRGRGSEGGYEEMRMEGSPVAEMYDRLSKRRTSSLL